MYMADLCNNNTVLQQTLFRMNIKMDKLVIYIIYLYAELVMNSNPCTLTD